MQVLVALAMSMLYSCTCSGFLTWCIHALNCSVYIPTSVSPTVHGFLIGSIDAQFPYKYQSLTNFCIRYALKNWGNTCSYCPQTSSAVIGSSPLL